MAAKYGFHPEALAEYTEAAEYYLREASPQVADRFGAAVEAAIAALVAAPMRYRVVEAPEVRRYILSRFPFVIYYRWEPVRERVTIYAVMHGKSRAGLLASPHRAQLRFTKPTAPLIAPSR